MKIATIPLNIGVNYRKTIFETHPIRNALGVALWKDVVGVEQEWATMFTLPTNETCLCIDQYAPTNLEVQLIFVTDRGIYLKSGTGYTKLADYIGADTRAVSSCMWLDWWLCTDMTNPIKKYDGSAVSNLGGNPPLARYITVARNFCILGFVQEGGVSMPYRVQWSDVGNPEVWNSGLAGFIDLLDTPDWVQKFGELGGECYVFKERSIWHLAYTAYPTLWTPVAKIKGVGLLGSDTLDNIGEEFVFLGSDNVYTFDGRTLTAIGDPVWEVLFGPTSMHDRDHLASAHGLYVEELEEYWLIVDDRIYAYHFPTKTWWVRKAPGAVSAVGVWQKDRGDQWDEQTATWDTIAYSVTWDSTMLKPSSFTTLLAIPNELRTTQYDVVGDQPAEIILGGVAAQDLARVRSVIVEAKGDGWLQVSISTDNQQTWTALSTKRVQADAWCWFRFPWTYQLTKDVFVKLEFQKVFLRQAGFEVTKVYTRRAV